MRLRDAGEIEFLRLVLRDIAGTGGTVHLGAGDDAAIVVCPVGKSLVLTCDAMVAGEHFRREWLSNREIGARAVGAAVSDIAAMGGCPTAILLTLLVSPDEDLEAAREVVKGAAEAAAQLGARLVGGETVGTSGPLALDVMVAGFIVAGRELRRSAARPGDALLISGTLGDSRAGLAALEAGLASGEAADHVISRYKSPRPRLDLGLMLVESCQGPAAIDVSDGLVRDAGHLAEDSGVAITIEAGAVPISEPCREIAQMLSADPLMWALGGGEDFELLFTADQNAVDQIIQTAQNELSVEVSRIGRVDEGQGVYVRRPDGSEVAVDVGGWDQFR